MQPKGYRRKNRGKVRVREKHRHVFGRTESALEADKRDTRRLTGPGAVDGRLFWPKRARGGTGLIFHSTQGRTGRLRQQNLASNPGFAESVPSYDKVVRARHQVRRQSRELDRLVGKW